MARRIHLLESEVENVITEMKSLGEINASIESSDGDKIVRFDESDRLDEEKVNSEIEKNTEIAQSSKTTIFHVIFQKFQKTYKKLKIWKQI